MNFNAGNPNSPSKSENSHSGQGNSASNQLQQSNSVFPVSNSLFDPHHISQHSTSSNQCKTEIKSQDVQFQFVTPPHINDSDEESRKSRKITVMDTPFTTFKHEPIPRTQWKSQLLQIEEKEELDVPDSKLIVRTHQLKISFEKQKATFQIQTEAPVLNMQKMSLNHFYEPKQKAHIHQQTGYSFFKQMSLISNEVSEIIFATKAQTIDQGCQGQKVSLRNESTQTEKRHLNLCSQGGMNFYFHGNYENHFEKMASNFEMLLLSLAQNMQIQGIKNKKSKKNLRNCATQFEEKARERGSLKRSGLEEHEKYENSEETETCSGGPRKKSERINSRKKIQNYKQVEEQSEDEDVESKKKKKVKRNNRKGTKK